MLRLALAWKYLKRYYYHIMYSNC